MEPIQNLQETPDPQTEALKKRKLWRNLFLFNLCLSLVLIGLFWLPAKLVQMDKFMSSPSVNVPKEGEVAETTLTEEEKTGIPQFENVLGTQYAVVNASFDDKWVYFDFSRGSAVQVHDHSSLAWDLAFRRSKVVTNGGATNKFGQAGVLDLGDEDFDTLLEVPLQGYVMDKGTRTETENPVLLSWYKYNYLTHKLTAKDNIYAIRTADNKYAKVQFLSFYCENKETGCIKMRYVYQDNGSNSFLKSATGVTSVAGDPKTNSS